MKEFVNKALEEIKATCLATIDEDGNPSTRGIFNLRNIKMFPSHKDFFNDYQEDLSVFISTNTSSVKHRQIVENPMISITYLFPDDGKGITLKGKAEIIEDISIKERLWLKWFDKYYPKGVRDPDYSIIKLKPKRVEIWYRGKYVFDLE